MPKTNKVREFTLIQIILFLTIYIFILCLIGILINYELAGIIGTVSGLIPAFFFKQYEEGKIVVKGFDIHTDGSLSRVNGWIIGTLILFYLALEMLAGVIISLLLFISEKLMYTPDFVYGEILTHSIDQFEDDQIVLISFVMLANFFGGYVIGKNLKKYQQPYFYSAIISFIAKGTGAFGSFYLFYYGSDNTDPIDYLSYIILGAFIALSLCGTWVALREYSSISNLQKKLRICVLAFITILVFVIAYNLLFQDKDNPVTFNDYGNSANSVTGRSMNIDGDTFESFSVAYFGDTVCFSIYYHNTSNFIAKNTRISFNCSFAGQALIGSAAITCANSKKVWLGHSTIIFPEIDSNIGAELRFVSTYWFPNQDITATPLLNKQKGDEIFTDGIIIGDIYPPTMPNYNILEHEGYIYVKVSVHKVYL